MTSSRLRLHFNENTADCSPVVLAALRSLTTEDIATYPDLVAHTERLIIALEDTLASRTN
jgi:histidinol-phosphate/aromatic aminotransferase/cobyric acid decarboxylase-like protein